MKYIACLFMLGFTYFCFGQSAIDAHYKIYNVNLQKEITLDDIVADFNHAEVLFFGEIHTDSVDHYLEYTLLTKLNAAYPGKVALSMEMFETDCQPVVNEYFRGLIRERNFMIDARVWKNYGDYRPLVEFAKSAKMSLIAANAPARYTNMVTRMGLKSLLRLDSAGKSHLPPLPIDTAKGQYYLKFLDVMGGHTTMDGMQVYQAQNLWDATMGWSIASYLKNHNGSKVLHLNGGFHSEGKLGSPAQLLKYAPGTQVLNIAAIADYKPAQPDWSRYKTLGDYVIVTEINAQ